MSLAFINKVFRGLSIRRLENLYFFLVYLVDRSVDLEINVLAFLDYPKPSTGHVFDKDKRDCPDILGRTR